MAKYKSIFTRAVHVGERGPRPDFKPVSTPIYNSVGYLYEDLKDLDAVFGNERPGYVYARYGNPTNSALEEVLADLEEGSGPNLWLWNGRGLRGPDGGRGQNRNLSPLSAFDVYGATYAICARLLPDWGVKARFVDVTDLGAVENALAELKPVAIILETISNPLIKVPDIPAISRLAHRAGAKVIVDNTFATPVLFRPLKFGADFCVHSTTKYIGGHGDVLGGAIVSSKANRDILLDIIKMTGGNLGPAEAWLTLRGVKTLPLRLRQHCTNATEVAKWLQGHPQISRVNYPGLAHHPQHELATKLFPEGLFGGMISFEIKNAGKKEIFRFMESLDLVLPATTLGDVYSLTLYPAMSSHRALSPEERKKFGISDSLVRLSVGIEEVGEIIGDLEQALDKIK